MSKYDEWIKEISKTHDVPNAPFVVEAMKAAFIGGRESVLKQWPSEEEIWKAAKYETSFADSFNDGIRWLKSRLGDNE